MTYATVDDLLHLADRQRLVELTDRGDPPAGAIDQARVDAALVDAAAQIDARIGQRYALPLSPVPVVLRRITAVIAYHDLHIEDVPDKVAEDYRRAVAWLDGVASGATDLPGQGSSVMSLGGVGSEGQARVTSRDALKGF